MGLFLKKKQKLVFYFCQLLRNFTFTFTFLITFTFTII